MGTDQKALNALAKGAGVTAIGMFISKVLTYLYRVSIARFIGPDAYGQLSLAIMVIGFGSTIGLLATNQGLQKFIPEFRTQKDKSKIRGVFLSSLYIVVPTSLIISITIFFGAEFIAIEVFNTEDLVPVLKIMSAAPFFGSISKVFFDTTIGFNKIIYKVGVTNIIQNVVQLALTLILIISGFQVLGAAWGWLIGTITSAILGFYIVERKIGPIVFSNIKPHYQFRELLNFSSPLLLSGIILTTIGWADTAFLGYFMSDTDVGLYNAALPTAMLILLPHKAIGSLAVSSFSELKERNNEKIEESIQTATHWSLALCIPLFLMFVFFSKEILFILFGPEYQTVSSSLSILAVAYILTAITGRTASFFQAVGHTKYIFYNNIALLSLNITLNAFLIPLYGIAGAALATATSTIAANTLMFIEVWRKEEIITISPKTPKIALSGIIAILPVMILDHLLFTDTPLWFIFPAGLIYAATYIIAFLKLIGINKEEKQIILRIGEKTGQKNKINSILDTLT